MQLLADWLIRLGAHKGSILVEANVLVNLLFQAIYFYVRTEIWKNKSYNYTHMSVTCFEVVCAKICQWNVCNNIKLTTTADDETAVIVGSDKFTSYRVCVLRWHTHWPLYALCNLLHQYTPSNTCFIISRCFEAPQNFAPWKWGLLFECKKN